MEKRRVNYAEPSDDESDVEIPKKRATNIKVC